MAITKAIDDKENIRKVINEMLNSGGGNGGQKENRFSFHQTHNRILSNLIIHVITWAMNCFTKYSEEQFHIFMKNRYTYFDELDKKYYLLDGFDFIKDWNDNHKQSYSMILKTVRFSKIKIKEEMLYQGIIMTIASHGWKLSDEEKKGFYWTVRRLYNILYNKVDTVREGQS